MHDSANRYEPGSPGTRVARVSGSLEIESAPDEGTAVRASVPAIGPEQAP